MSHFAEVDENGIVLRVIVAEQDFIDTGHVGDPKRWIQTSYNTREGVHDSGGVPLRKNYAGRGYTYDQTRDAFIPPKPEFPSWSLDEQKCVYIAPKPMPQDGKPQQWDEVKQDWTAVAADIQAVDVETPK